MYTLQIPNNPIYSITGTLPELMEKLASEFLASRDRPTDGYESYLEAVWPTDPSELDEGEDPPYAAEINKDTVVDFAAKVWDTPAPFIELSEDIEPLTAGEFQAMQHHLGLSNTDMAKTLNVDVRRLARWIAGTQPIPVGITGEMDDLLDQHDADVEKILEKADRGIPIIYPGDTSEQETDWAFGWERRIVQRAVVEHGIKARHRSEFTNIDYFESN